MSWKLQSMTGDLSGQEISVERDLLVGRHQDADVVLTVADVSRRHAALLVKDEALWVKDLNSSNGTFVNDLRIEHETLVKDGDVIQFSTVKYLALAPAVAEPVVAAEPAAVETPVVEQPFEAFATTTPEHKPSPAEQMSEQGMPELSARDENVQLSRDGMPTNVSVPKPAPIPENVDIHTPATPEACEIKTPDVCAEKEVETQKNAQVGLMTIIALVILAVIAWLFFK